MFQDYSIKQLQNSKELFPYRSSIILLVSSSATIAFLMAIIYKDLSLFWSVHESKWDFTLFKTVKACSAEHFCINNVVILIFFISAAGWIAVILLHLILIFCSSADDIFLSLGYECAKPFSSTKQLLIPKRCFNWF